MMYPQAKIRLALVIVITTFACILSSTISVQSAEEYGWSLVNNGGGSNTTGIYIHPLDSNIMYLRLGDTGGYRWDAANEEWIPMTDWNRNSDYASNIEGMAIDPSNKNIVYYSSGSGKNSGEIFKSTDQGLTFTASKLKKPDGKKLHIRGAEGGSAFERMAVDPNNGDVIYYATKFNQGLWRSTAASAPGSWALVDSFTPRGDSFKTYKVDGTVSHKVTEESGLSFVTFDQNGGTTKVNGQTVSKIIYVGVCGDRQKQIGGHGGAVEIIPESGVWRSTDGGQSWKHLSGLSTKNKRPQAGKVASDGTLYITVSGKIAKVTRDSDVLVDLPAPKGEKWFIGLAVDHNNPHHLVVARSGLATSETPYTPSKNGFYRSIDGGATWQTLDVTYETAAPWVNGFAQYVSFVAFDPNNSKKVWFGDWSQPWRCDDITAATTHWKQISKGHNGDYVIGLATQPGKPNSKVAKVFSANIDIAGFRFTNLTTPPEQKITHVKLNGGARDPGLADGVSIDYSEREPKYMAIVGGWDHGGRGGGAVSKDNGKTWTGFKGMGVRYSNGSTIYKYGRIAIGATKQDEGYPFLVHIPRFRVPRYSHDFGQTWTDATGAPASISPSEWSQSRPLAADKVDGKKFYAFNNAKGRGEVYRTTDGGVTWSKAGAVKYNWSGRTMKNYNIKAMPGNNGEVWLGLNDEYSDDTADPAMGLHRSTDSGSSWKKVADFNRVYSFSFGAPAPGRNNMALYVFGKQKGVEGIYRSDDATSLKGDLKRAKWVQIYNRKTDKSAQGVIRGAGNLEADRQIYGRVYVGTIARGLWFGDFKSRVKQIEMSSKDVPSQKLGGKKIASKHSCPLLSKILRIA